MTSPQQSAALAAEWAQHADLNLREARHSRTQAQSRASGLDSEQEAQQTERWQRRAEQSTAKAKEARLMALMWAAVASARAPIEALPAACVSASWHDEHGVHRCKGGHSPDAKHSDGVQSWDTVEIIPPAEPTSPSSRCPYCGCLDRHCDKCLTECALPPFYEPGTSKPIAIRRRSAPDVLRFHADVLAQISRGAVTAEAHASITAARVGMNLLADQLEAQD
ncbi:hypothetical protein ACEZCY_13980 [Streptacidiphilus sp. N1-12]|uniref:Uncharacterized protein n=2 Tax=Streptacidiphilus alkalitolerans TaxID=3342712 RepID=A0ABV6V9H1_9ACTN